MAVGPLTASIVDIESGAFMISNQANVFLVTIANAGATPTTVTGIQGYASPPGAVYFPNWTPNTNQTVTVPATGSVTVPISAIAFTDNRVGELAQPDDIYSISALVTTADGSVTAASSPLSVEVNRPGYGLANSPPGGMNAVLSGRMMYMENQNTPLYFFFP